jgi:hypothetical protein
MKLKLTKITDKCVNIKVTYSLAQNSLHSM